MVINKVRAAHPHPMFLGVPPGEIPCILVFTCLFPRVLRSCDCKFVNPGRGGGGNSHIKKRGMLVVHLRVSSLKRSTAGAFIVPFRVLSGKILIHLLGFPNKCCLFRRGVSKSFSPCCIYTGNFGETSSKETSDKVAYTFHDIVNYSMIS